MPRLASTLLTIVALLASACNDDPDDALQCVPNTEAVPLINNMMWVPLGAAEDPLASHRPQEVVCEEDALTFEGTASSVLEIDMGRCNYVALVQTMPVEIKPCDTVQLVLTHETLFADAPATAHAAVVIGDQVVWEQEFPIPFFDSELLTPAFTVPEGVPAGSPIVFHLHNHGLNTWNLLSVSLTPQ